MSAEGYEADDVPGTLATRAAADSIAVVIVAGDSDAVMLAWPMLRDRRLDAYAIVAYNRREQVIHHDSLPRIQA